MAYQSGEVVLINGLGIHGQPFPINSTGYHFPLEFQEFFYDDPHNADNQKDYGGTVPVQFIAAKHIR